MKTKILILSLVVFSFVVILIFFPTLDTTPQELETSINTALKPGDSTQKIEQYLASKNLASSYDGFSNRYQGIIRHPDSSFHAIVFYIYVDKSKAFIKVEAHDSYTFI
jgi:hypothetical protein